MQTPQDTQKPQAQLETQPQSESRSRTWAATARVGAVAAAVPAMLFAFSAPASAAELAPIAGAVDNLLAVTLEQLGVSALLGYLGL